MRRFKIKTTLSAIFVGIALMVGTFAAYTLDRLRAVDDKVGEVANVWMPTLEKVKDIEVRLGDIRTAYRNHILQPEDAGKRAAVELIEQSVELLENDMLALQGFSTSDAQRILLRKIKESFGEYVSKGREVLVLSASGQEDKAAKWLREVMMERAEGLRNASAQLSKITKTASENAYIEVERDFSATFTVAIGSVAVLLVVVAGAVYFVATNVARPIERITLAMRGLTDGDLGITVPFADRNDEIGDMSRAVEIFRMNAVENRRLEKETADSRSEKERDRDRHARDQAHHAEALEQATQGLGDGLRHLAGGDLEFRLTEAFATDFEPLRADFNSAAETLRNTLFEVIRTTGSIDGGSSEISRSVDNLSKRTEQQAAALEETAAALDEITANVAQSAKRADEARNTAKQAALSTDRSGTIVNEAIVAMVKIEQSSNQIAGIIAVIDEIAFQTNLLALNAGVEAARAGEAGKGFAVVAQEVRELAQRSAGAAREIKNLIQSSRIDVESGVQLVKDTGEALRSIEGQVNAINLNMDAIATSTNEQSTGLLQVNAAINQMDQVTQQNAAMVEETNGASATLAAETNHLRRLVERFSLGSMEATRSGTLRLVEEPSREGNSLSRIGERLRQRVA
ncbi:Methyl-accepting chemotaxis protein I [Ensifer sp. M14]|uniref:HAMP domain-containing methyl-accepting chemotaxis protein n=1 Tax=Ensifer sp. M14 TaxID=2203782 RepID=UPI000E2ADF43|nr:HAMP domain-containing methyl-accepting chemotaxis protein [Ensifer sp. M14]RDL48412.1 Methyl-accepting chemotaxis protein I [Ensifer sp. M14]